MSNSQIIRSNGRPLDAMRSIEFIRNYTKYAEGSVLTVFGDTKVICTARIGAAFSAGKGTRMADGGIQHVAAFDTYPYGT